MQKSDNLADDPTMARSSRSRCCSALLVAAGLILGACGQESGDSTPLAAGDASAETTAPSERVSDGADGSTTDRTELDDAEDLFNSTVGSHYVLTFELISQVSAEAGPIRVEVADGRATNVTYPDVMAEQILPQIPMLTVADFFERARAVLADGGAVEIDFDESYGYPLSMTLDPIPEAIDDEMSIVVQSIEPLEVSFEPDGY